MAKTMGRYCKAYPVDRFRSYPRWTENTARLRPSDGDATEETSSERSLTNEDFLYLHENYLVTDGVFQDEYVIFDDVTPEWIEFCQRNLNFKVPE